MTILVTGGTGYIGSHVCVNLLDMDKEIVIVDNLSNSSQEVINRIEKITAKRPLFYKIDLSNKFELEKVFKKHKIDSVIHFAGLKAVGESVNEPLKYYRNNILASINLFELMKEYNIKKIVFSSSATVYGRHNISPLSETATLQAESPYGNTKLVVEQALKDLYNSDNGWSISILRYFNPLGAHESGLIGENPSGVPNNIMPYISQVAIGKLSELRVFGNDYETTDGSGVRDYIHVIDLANGHLKALEKIQNNTGLEIYNLGTGKGCSVFELISQFEQVNNVHIPYVITQRRAGDLDICFADTKKAKVKLDWEAKKSIEDMCKDTWRWQLNNPQGY